MKPPTVTLEWNFELYKTYGWGKFIVVVPSIAIREGVKGGKGTMVSTTEVKYHDVDNYHSLLTVMETL